MHAIQIFYTKFVQPLPDYLYSHYYNYLPTELRKKNSRYIRWQDRHAHLLGKMLLLKGLNIFGYNRGIFSELIYNSFDRPYIASDIDFNLSHSGEFVLCAIGKGIRVGVDIEIISAVDFDDFKEVMTDKQWIEIQAAENPFKAFFTFWTIKESVIKADSRGLSIPLLELHVTDSTVMYEKQTWYLHDISLDNSYCACLATNCANINIEMINLDFEHEILLQ